LEGGGITKSLGQIEQRSATRLAAFFVRSSWRDGVRLGSGRRNRLWIGRRKHGTVTKRTLMVSGVNVSVVHRFLGGERDITLTTASKLAHLIGLQLTRKKKRTTKV